MPTPDAPVLALIFGSFGILVIAVAFVLMLVRHQRRWMGAMAERTRYREALLEATSVGRLVPWSCALDGGRLDIGASVATILGGGAWTHLDDLLGRLGREQAEALRRTLRALAPGEDALFTAAMQESGGAWLDTHWQVGRRGEALQGTIRDISKEQRLQRQLLVAQKLEALGTMVGGIAHEFGNLLGAVESCARAVQRREGLDDKGHQGLSLILDATQRGRAIIRQLLDLGRREADQIVPRLDLNRLSEEVASLLRPMLGRHFRLALELDPGLPAVAGDPIRLHQALLNLCINARDAMPEGGRLVVRSRQVVLASDESGRKPAGRYACLEVEDEGTGIDPEHLARIFEPFFTTKGPGQGTGLGLSVTHSIAEAHGGLLQCDSSKGRGSRFSLLLPLA